MLRKLFRTYRFKFYLNASHSIIIAGRQGDVHPHTWELTLIILTQREEMVEFADFEKAIEQFLTPFQNRTINDLSPFDTTIPTLENLVEYFGDALRSIIREKGGELLQIEGSETPSRSYVISYVQSPEYASDTDQYTQSALGKALDHLLEDML